MAPVKSGLAAFAAAIIFVCQGGAFAAPEDPTRQQPPAQKPAKQTAQPASNPPTPAKPKAQKPSTQTPPKQSAAQPASSGKSVCVASALGHRFEVKKIGLMVFGNSLDEVAVDSWGIDDAAVRTIAQTIGKDFNVRRIDIPKAALTEFETSRSGWFRNSYNELMQATAAASPGCQYYVMLTRAVTNYAGTNQHVAGLGMLHHGIGLLERVYVFASYVIHIYDGNTLAPLRTEKPTTDPILVTGLTGGMSAMYRKIETTWWPATPQAAAQNAQLKNMTRALVEEGLTKKLPQIFEGS